MILDGYCLAKTDKKFVVIGNTGNGFGKHLVAKYKNNHRVIFRGAIFDEEKVQTLTAYCSLYFHGHSVGGTNPSLLDAMAAKVPLAAHDNPFNISVLRYNAVLFGNASHVRDLINANNFVNKAHIENNYTAIKNEFTWDMIIGQYEKYFVECHPATQFHLLQHKKKLLYKGQY